MATPITGPISIVRQAIPPVWPGTHYPNPGYAEFRMQREWYRQRRPYDRPLPFYFISDYVTKYNQLPQYQAANGGWFYLDYNDEVISKQRSWAKNEAIAKFNGKVKESASWLVSLAEGKQAMAMMTNRLTQLGHVTKQLLKGRVDLAAKELGVFGSQDYRTKRKLGKIKANAKAAADNFIELSFGWRPLVSDIYKSADILQRPFPLEAVKGFARVPYSIRGNYIGFAYYYVGHVQCTVGAYVSVSNPNLYLANSLGLLNPATVAFELIPWSFILGWFVNVEQFLSQFTEYAGLSVTNPYYTEGSKNTARWIWEPNSHLGEGDQVRIRLERKVGVLPSVDLTVKKPWHLSAWRGATAASLVVQNLSVMQPRKF